MKNRIRHSGSVLLFAFEIIVGVLLLVNPVAFTTWIIITFGVILLVVGIASIIRYLRAEAKEAAASRGLMKGLILMAAGGFCACRSEWFLATFPMLTVVYGILLLISGLGKVQWTVDMLRMRKKKWFLAAIGAVVTIACAVVVLRDPFTSTEVMWTFTGIALIVEAALDLLAMILNSRKSSSGESRLEIIDVEEKA